MITDVSYEDTPSVWPEDARQGFRIRSAKERAVIAQGDRDLARDIVRRVSEGGLNPDTAVALSNCAVALAKVAEAEEGNV